MCIHDDWLLTPQLVALHMATATGVVADLHLGYSDARQRGGEAVPCARVETVLAPLTGVIRAFAMRRLVIAGDLFEAACEPALVNDLVTWLGQWELELAGVVPGNHDRGIERHARLLPLYPRGFCLGDWLVVHGDGDLPPGRVVHGHEHPCLRPGGRAGAPCYLSDARRIILPAFSPDARGVNVLGVPAWRHFRCHVVLGPQVLDFGKVAAVSRAARTAGRR
jgi:metallophosphoesterase superfamily enzyme